MLPVPMVATTMTDSTCYNSHCGYSGSPHGGGEIDPGWRRRDRSWTATTDYRSHSVEIDFEAATMWLDGYGGGGIDPGRRRRDQS
jgi:hypothetical protein